MPLSAHKEISTPQKFGEAVLVQLAIIEDTTWEYDDRRFLRTTATLRRKRNDEDDGSGGILTSFPVVETVIETRTTTVEGWVTLLTTHTSFDPKTGKLTGTSTQSPQDQAGFPPGGPRRPFSFSTFISAPVREGTDPDANLPVRVRTTLSSDPTAVALRYANPNLTREDLEFILAQAREASGLVEYPLTGRGPALPDVLKGTALHLTGFLDEAGVEIPLEPAQVRSITFDYQDTREAAGFACSLAAVFYRRE